MTSQGAVALEGDDDFAFSAYTSSSIPEPSAADAAAASAAAESPLLPAAASPAAATTTRKPGRRTGPAAAAAPPSSAANASHRESNRAFRASLEPDDNTAEAQRLNTRFANSLKLLLGVYVFTYLLESTLGEFSPIGPDMVLLLLGWIAYEGYRVRALKLYVILTGLSIFIDTLGFIASLTFVLAREFPTWITTVLVMLFVVETVFKVSSIFQARQLRAHLEIVHMQPVESALLNV